MKMTQVQHKRLARLDATLSRETDNVFAAALPRNDVPFWTCLKMSTHTQRAAYESARDAKESFQRQMIDEGRAWRSENSSLFFPNHK